jgi:NTE family protein
MRTRLLNTGELPKAVAASCAVPLMFHPVKIGSRLFYDGGVFHKTGLNAKDPDERILCVFLESEGLTGFYERKVTFKGFTPKHKILNFKKLPRVSFHTLERGVVAYEEALQRARRALNLPAAHFLVEA